MAAMTYVLNHLPARGARKDEAPLFQTEADYQSLRVWTCGPICGTAANVQMGSICDFSGLAGHWLGLWVSGICDLRVLYDGGPTDRRA